MIVPTEVHLTLFLSRATPLSRWQKMGILDRELAIYKALAARLGGVSIVSSGGPEELDCLDGHPNLQIFFNRWGLSPNLYSLLAPFLHWRALQKVTIYKTNQMDGAWTALIAGFLHHKPVIARAGYLWSQLNRRSGGRGLKANLIDRLQAFTLRRADKVFLTSQGISQLVSQTYSLANDKIAVIPNYVDTELFRPLTQEKPAPGRVCYAGRLHAIKNLDNLILAIKEITGAQLVLLGEGDQRQALEELARQQDANVSFLGALPNSQVPVEINHSQVFVLPSLAEGHPKALIEAMACGAAVVGADVPGIREVIQHGKNGLLCQTDAASLAEAIRKLLEDPDLRKKLGANAKRFAIQNYALDHIVELELNQIMEVVNAA